MRTMGAATAMGVILCMAAAARADFGDAFTGLTQDQFNAFTKGRDAFRTTERPDQGLGPVFNGTSCVQCHGGTTGPTGGNTTQTETRFGRLTGTNFNALTDLGGSLIQEHGIGVETVNTALPGCASGISGEVVPTGPGQANVVAGRRTTPLFGLGLVDATPDATFVNLATAQARNTPSTAGIANSVPTTEQNQIGRFGWKAQNATLHIFAGDAYVNEMGITNPQFPDENCPQGNCALLQCVPLASDNILDDDGTDVTNFTNFMTLLAPPPRGPLDPNNKEGENVFSRIGCADCHTPTLTTGPNAIAPLNKVDYHPYSDFLLHDMGSLGDGITQGNATGRLMRTAPLWGVRVQTTLLHDGRVSTVTDAINAHDGQGAAARAAFNALNATQRGKLLAFLASL